MSIVSKIKNSSKNSKLVIAAALMAVFAGGLAYASTQNTKQSTAKTDAKKESAGTHTITTKDGKKLTVPNATKLSPSEQAKANSERLQKRIESSLKQKRITDAQAKLITAKAAEASKVNVSKLDTPARTKFQKELYSWAKENKIPLSFVFEMSRPRS